MENRNPERGSAAAWLLPPAVLLAIVAVAVLARRGTTGLFGWIVGGLVGLVVLWVLVSALWPARAERGCPACGADELERLDPETTHGIVCRACGHRDETRSSWLLAEEEGPLEPMVLRERRERRAHRRRRRTVDRPARAD